MGEIDVETERGDRDRDGRGDDASRRARSPGAGAGSAEGAEGTADENGKNGGSTGIEGRDEDDAGGGAIRIPTPRFVRRLGARLGIGVPESTALRIWVLSRIAVFVFAYNVAWITQPRTTYGPRSFGHMFERWDWLRYQGIAAHGYSLEARHGSSIAFFPGYPLILRIAHYGLRSWVYTGLIISFVAGAIAAAALARIIALEARERFGTGERGLNRTRTAVREGTLMWVLAPAAFFLAAGYTEAPFLAFALPAWLAARNSRWLLSGVLMIGASAIRINGVFEVVAVGVLFLTQVKPRRVREWLRAWPLVLPLLPVIVYMGYLWHRTGDWDAWQHAQQKGWNRHLTDPFHALVNTFHYAFGGRILPANNAWEYQLEIVAMVVGAALLLWLLWRRRWAEAVFVGFSVVSLGISHTYLSIPREMLLWWPMWALLGVWTVRRPWIRTVYLCVSTPLMFTVSYLFLMGLWSG